MIRIKKKEICIRLTRGSIIAAVLVATGTINFIIIGAMFSAAFTPCSVVINHDARIVTSCVFLVNWDEKNPDEIVDIRWKGSSNLTNKAVISGCPSDLEYFGNSWGASTFVSLVGWGTSGTWDNPRGYDILINSVSRGCPVSAEIPIQTWYRFYNQGPTVNRIRVQRQFEFGTSPFELDFRPYIARLHPRAAFQQILYPDARGTSLITDEIGETFCAFGCLVDNWNGVWFAIHDPSSRRGVIVRHSPSPFDVALWLDQDAYSDTTASAILLVQPPGGFTGTVLEVEYLCFYDSTIWTPSTTLPVGC